MLNRLRLFSAIVMSIFVFTHLANLSLALVSGSLTQSIMDWGMAFSIDPWRTVPGTVLLAGAFLVHFFLALHATYKRKTLRFKGWEIPQHTLGFLIPFFLAYHLMGTGIGLVVWDLDGDYTSQLLLFWYLAPEWCVGQILLLIVAWTHSYVGFHTWLRLRPWYSTYKPLISGFFLVLPTLALAGFVSGGLRTRVMIQQALEDGGAAALGEWRLAWGMTDAVHDSVVRYTLICLAGYVGLLAAVALLRQTRISFLSRSKGSELTYNGKICLRVLPGETLLEALRAAGLNHASVCGGKGRCSTCRIRVTHGLDLLEPPSKSEGEVLSRISAPPGVRLACQLRPTTDLEVTSLLTPSVGPEAAFSESSQGEELELTVLFCDLRRFSQLAEEKLPYDVVFILNRFFDAMGQAVQESGGHIDKFLGDGLMALYGIQDRSSDGCSRALSAAHLMATKLDELNHSLASELERPLEIGIGIEVGRAIVGEVGHGRSKSLTAIGNCVNTASRFQELCKDFSCQLVVSVEAASKGKWDLSRFPIRDVVIRGQTETRNVYEIKSALDALPPGP
jgi:adenylate cyclase